MCAYFVVLVFFAGMPDGEGGPLDQLKHLAAEGEVYEAACTLCFDLTFVRESPKHDTFVLERFLGQQVVGTDGRWRIEFQKDKIFGGKETQTREHYLRNQDGTSVYFLGLTGGAYQSIRRDKRETSAVGPPLRRVNPVSYVASGGIERSRRNVDYLLRTHVDNVEEYRDVYIRNTNPKAAAAVHKFEFDPHEFGSLLSRDVFSEAAECARPPKSREYPVDFDFEKEWHLSLEVKNLWTEVDGIRLPLLATSVDRYLVCNDPSEVRRFEGYFFDIEFEFDSNLLDESNFSPGQFTKDFDLDRIRKRSEEVRAEAQAQLELQGNK